MSTPIAVMKLIALWISVASCSYRRPSGELADELLRPDVDLAEIGEAALRERPQQVERGGGLVVAPEHPPGVGRPRLSGRLVAVHDVAAERRQNEVADGLGRLGAGLDELAGDPADLHHRQAGRVREHGRHLQDDLQLLPQVRRVPVVERLGAVAGLEQERPALDHVREPVEQASGLAGEDERRHPADLGADLFQPRLVGPVGLLERREAAPRRRRPGCGGHGHFPQCSEWPKRV